jgi:predicted transcriptional regulator
MSSYREYLPFSGTIVKIQDRFSGNSKMENENPESGPLSIRGESAKVLFELSNEDRLRILSMLEKKRMRLSTLAQETSLTIQETSRHLERLTHSWLIDKNVDGEYFLTQIGRLCLEEFSPIEFIVSNREYFFEHDVSGLPKKFQHRLGELRSSTFAGNVTDVLRHTQEVLKGARKYVLLMADQPLIPGLGPDQLPTGKQIAWKSIIPRSALSSESNSPQLVGNAENRFIDHPKVAIALNEEIAGVTFPDLKGRLDMSAGFSGSGKEFHDWCQELFYYYWDIATGNIEPKVSFEF